MAVGASNFATGLPNGGDYSAVGFLDLLARETREETL